MARKIQKLLAVLVVMSMCMSLLSFQVLATEVEETTTNPDGTTMVITTTTEAKTDESGNPTVVVTIKKDINAEIGNNVTTDGVTVVLDANRTETYGSDGTDENGNPIKGELKQYVDEGTEKKDQVKEKDSGDEPGQPTISVVLKPGQTTEGSAIIEDTEKVEGDVPTDENDPDYDYTKTYETERTVTAETSDITVTEGGVKVNMGGLDIVQKNDAEGLSWVSEKPKNTAAKFDYVKNADGKYVYVPRYVRDNSEMPDWLKSSYTYDENTQLWTPKKYDPTKPFESGSASTNKPIIETDDDFNFVFTQTGEQSDYTILLADGWRVNADPNTGEAYKFKVEKDADGNVIRDVNGNPTYVLNGNSLIQDPDGEPYDIYSANIRVCDEYGNVYFTYCMDIDTGTIVGDTYVLENLDDATYFEGTEEEQAAAKAHVRAVALNGYWGTETGTGSLDQIKANLIDFINTTDDFEFTYNDPEVILGNPDAAKTESKTYSTATEEGKAELRALVERLNEGAALAVTNSAIWEYGRGNQDPVMAFDKESWVTDPEFNHAMLLFREYLLSDQLCEKVNGENSAVEKETIIIDENSFLAEDGLELKIGDKVEGLAQNTDENQDNDVYNADLSFTMVVTPSENDDLIVTLVDADGVVVRKARLAGDSSKDDNTIFSSVTKDGNTYTFKDLQLTENSEFKFDLKLEGYQNLEQGVYIYKSSTGNYDDAQTLIGVSEGERTVDVNTSFTVTFDVDENNHIRTERNWRDTAIFDDGDDDVVPPDGDDDVTPPGDDDDDDTELGDDDVPLTDLPDGDTPQTDIPEEDVPLADAEKEELVDMIDEEIPLAEAPATGDASALWLMLSALSGSGLLGLTLADKKREED